MNEISNDQLIKKAISVIRPKTVGDRLFADVGCALVTDKGNIYLGICIDTASGTGFCAEHSAIAAMITAGEYRIKKIVAVWMDKGKSFVISPCGRCRELIRQVDEGNLDTEVILDNDRVKTVAELLPDSKYFVK